jgi:hypothetical protein
MKTLAPVWHRAATQYGDWVHYDTVAEYREHFSREYCQNPIYTFDSIEVAFRPDDFNHAFFKSGDFLWPRAHRIDWIAKALQDPSAWLCPGWDWSIWDYNRSRRVCFVNRDYVVVIEFMGSDKAFFKTAYVADGNTPRKVMRSPRW